MFSVAIFQNRFVPDFSNQLFQSFLIVFHGYMSVSERIRENHK